MQVALLLMVSQFFFSGFPIDWQMNQENVAVRGTVVDEGGHAVPRARVDATSPGFDAHTIADSKGQFIFLTLFPGKYCLWAARNAAYGDVYGSDVCALPEVPELFAGFEYDATIVLSR